MTLPALRNDLRLYPWQSAPHTGEALWALHDPMRNLFFLLPEDAVQILKRYDLGSVGLIVQRVNRETASQISATDVQSMVGFLLQNQLVTRPAAQAEVEILSMQAARREAFFNRLLHRYFFFRIPLWRPDAFLERTLPRVRFLFARWFFWATLLAGLTGIALTLRDWHSFEYQLRNLWSFLGLAKIVLTFVFVKLIHELAHAYTAKRFGVRVPIMGVAFLFMFPVPYTDTTESWKLYSHRERLAISAAGVASELMLAAWATLIWKIAPPGPMQEALFLIATTTWISSLLINLSPFMRFDGYFVLMDYLQIPNLHKRAGDLARWKLREVLFGLSEPIPERFIPRILRFLIGFAYVTWIYRLVVFLGIAVLLFFKLPQPLGLIVFAIEVYFMILRAILRELGVWWSKRGAIMKSLRSRLVIAILTALIVLSCVPLGFRQSVPGIYEPFHETVLYTQQDGEILEMHLEHGRQVSQGSLLLKLRSDELENELKRARMATERLLQQVGNSAVSVEGAGLLSGRDRAWNTAIQQVTAIEDQIAQLEIHAPVSGRITDFSEDLQPGVFVARNTPVALMETGPRREIVLYVGEEIRSALRLGQTVTFFTHAAPAITRHAEVVFVAANPTRALLQPELASVHGGPLRSFPQGSRLVLDAPMFPVTLRIADNGLTTQRQPVTVFLGGDRQSLAGVMVNRLAYLVRREFGR
ncbi:hypothetical protein MWN63_10735 [Paradonghicola geojensis]|nr:hypothetical protein [Marivivens geojensis]